MRKRLRKTIRKKNSKILKKANYGLFQFKLMVSKKLSSIKIFFSFQMSLKKQTK